MSSDNYIPCKGTVIETQRGQFKIKLDDGDDVVSAKLSGKLRTNKIRVLLGDRVEVDVSIYDKTKGRITYRYDK